MSAEPYLSAVAPCAITGDAACAESYAATMGARMYQRLLTEEELAAYLDLHQAVLAEGQGFATYVKWATTAMLLSPHAMFRSELGEPDGDVYRLTGYEVATALSYLFRGTGADEALLEQARTGQLATAENIEAVAHALAFELDGETPEPGFRHQLLDFVWQWLGLGGFDVVTRPDPNFEWARDSMREEVERFLEHILFDQRGGPRELLTSEVTFIDGILGIFYGYPGPVFDMEVPVERPAEYGVGLLSQGAVITMHSSPHGSHPTRRGIFVRDKILCDPIPAPPPEVPELPKPTETETTRERFEVHVQDPACAGCHELLDGIGFGFEAFDEVGRYRATENGVEIDDRWDLLYVGDNDFQGIGLTALAQTLAEQPQTADCSAKMLLSYAFGGELDVPCVLGQRLEAFRAGDLSYVDLLLALAGTDHFRLREPE